MHDHTRVCVCVCVCVVLVLNTLCVLCVLVSFVVGVLKCWGVIVFVLILDASLLFSCILANLTFTATLLHHSSVLRCRLLVMSFSLLCP